MRSDKAILFVVPALMVFATPLSLASGGNAAPAQVDNPRGSLCARGEEVIFHCAVGRKMLSVCGGRRPAPHAQYRFGAPGDIELAFPGPDQSGLTYAREMYSGGGALQMNFSNGGYHYTVYSRTVRPGFRGRNNPRFPHGIMVRRGGRLLANRACTTEIRADAQPEEFMPEGNMLAWAD